MYSALFFFKSNKSNNQGLHTHTLSDLFNFGGSGSGLPIRTL